MSSKASGLLAQIETGVLDESVPLSSLLQKIIVLGGRAGSEKMREWARHELNGYGGEDDLPPYRHLHVPLYARITNPAGYNGIEQRIPPSVLHKTIRELVHPEQLNLGTGVGELEAMAAAAAGDQTKDPHRLSPGWGDLLANWLNEHHVDKNSSKVSAVYFQVPNASIKGLLVQIRTALAELVADLVSMTPEGEGVPTQTAADQAVQFILTGERVTVNYTNQQTSSGLNVAAPSAQSAVVATDSGTAIGSQQASGENSSVVGTQSAHGDDATLVGRDNAIPAPKEAPAGFWARLRNRGLFVALFTVIAGAVAVFTWIDWTPW